MSDAPEYPVCPDCGERHPPADNGTHDDAALFAHRMAKIFVEMGDEMVNSTYQILCDLRDEGKLIGASECEMVKLTMAYVMAQMLEAERVIGAMPPVVIALQVPAPDPRPDREVRPAPKPMPGMTPPTFGPRKRDRDTQN